MGSNNFFYSTFFYNVNEISLSSLADPQTIKDNKVTLPKILTSLENSSDYVNGKMHPIYFPLEAISGIKNIYIPYGLLKYQAVEFSTDTIPPVG